MTELFSSCSSNLDDLLLFWNLVEVTRKFYKQRKLHVKPHHKDNPSHSKRFSKDSMVITSRLFSMNPFFEEAFVKSVTNVNIWSHLMKKSIM